MYTEILSAGTASVAWWATTGHEKAGLGFTAPGVRRDLAVNIVQRCGESFGNLL